MKLLFTSNDLQPSLTIFIISSMIFGKHMVEVGFVYWQHKPHDKLCCESGGHWDHGYSKDPWFYYHWTLLNTTTVATLKLSLLSLSTSMNGRTLAWSSLLSECCSRPCQQCTSGFMQFKSLCKLCLPLLSRCDQSPPWSFIDSDNCPTASPLGLPWEPSSSARSFWASERADFAGSPCFSNSVIMCLAFAIASSFLENQT